MNTLAALAALAAASEAEERRAKQAKYLEALLPLALLLILGVFIAAKMGFIDLSFIPGFAKTTRVMILTDDATSGDIQRLIQVLTYQYPRHQRIEVSKMSLSPMRRIYASQLADYDVVILYQVRDKTLSMLQREEIARYVKNGGNLIVVLNSGTYMPRFDYYGDTQDASPVWSGWKDKYLREIMPVQCATEADCELAYASNARVATLNPDHPIMGGMEFYPESGSPIAVDYIPGIMEGPNGTTVADLEIISGEPSPNATVTATYPGIVVSSNIMGGKVVYFNYEPQQTPLLLINAIEWLS